MTAESMHSERGSSPSRPLRSSFRLRAARVLPALLAAMALVAACSNDDESPTLSRTDDTSGSSSAPLAQEVSAPTATIAILASPAQPLKQPGTDTSPVAQQPLAPPVIHTVD
jgi:peptidoglycan/LPS O-acetylase OafA/YrhL